MASSLIHGRVRVGEWLLLPSLNRIRKGERERQLEPKFMQVLLRLAAAPGEVLTREELLDAVWPGEVVTEHVLSRSISALRKALEDDASAPRYIETIRKGGYRLIAPVEEVPRADSPRSAAGPGIGRWLLVAALLIAAALLAAAALRRLSSDSPIATEAPEPTIVPLTSFHGSELDPALSPDGTKIAFSWSGEDDANFDVYVTSLRVERPVRLTTHPGEDKNPAWSPDGDRIAFVRASATDSGIYTVPVLGGAETRLVSTVSGDIPDLAWSADGRYLFFPDREAPSDPSGIFRLDVERRERTRVTTPPPQSYGDRDMAISPDGRWVAFARAVLPGVEDLYVQEVGSRAARRLTVDQAAIAGMEWLQGSSEVLFSSTRLNSSYLWRVRVSGGAPSRVAAIGDAAFDPSYSRAARRLVFERKRYETNIWRYDASDAPQEPRCVVSSTRWDLAPSLSPDGSKLAFISDRAGRADLWISDAEGGDLRHLDLGRQVLAPPGWSPDSTEIVVSVRNGRAQNIALVDVAASDLAFVSPSGFDQLLPTFSGDGAWIYFASNRTSDWQIWRVRRAGGTPEQITRGGGLYASQDPRGDGIVYTRPAGDGFWTLAEDGTELRLPLSPVKVLTTDWVAARSGIYAKKPVTSPTQAAAVVLLPWDGSPPLPILDLHGLQVPGLGLTVTPDETSLLVGRVDRDDGDIVLVEGFR